MARPANKPGQSIGSGQADSTMRDPIRATTVSAAIPRGSARIAEISVAPSGWDVVVEGVASTDVALVAESRRSAAALVLSLHVSDDGARAHVDTVSLELFGRDTIDFFVTDLADTAVREPLAVDLDLGSSESVGGRRWRSDARNRASLVMLSPAEVIAESGVFDADFYRSQAEGLSEVVDPIAHYVATGAAQGLDPSPYFDSSFYRRVYPDTRRTNPLAHYVSHGWKELRNPSPGFDTWWYWAKHLDLADESVMPLAHYVREGEAQGLSTRPASHPSRRLGEGHRFGADQVVRRVCLFAAYDADGVVDDYVVAYVRELSRFADVYYLADSEMAPGELDKLADITVGAWADRHGEYDFGSYKRLAERVGWDALERYDEMLLVNDSCYLLRPLDEVFSRMDAKACDWWGLRSTTRRHSSRDPHRRPIDLASLDVLVDRTEQRQSQYLHIPTEFVAFRLPVLRDESFRAYLSSFGAYGDRASALDRCEVGLTRWLVHHGHRFSTLIDDVYPDNAVLNGWYFRLVDHGFPLLKRELLATHWAQLKSPVPWKARVKGRVPDAPLEVVERHLQRVVSPARLAASLSADAEVEAHVSTSELPNSILLPEAFSRADRRIAKDASLWVFTADSVTGRLIGGARAVFEAVKDVEGIRKAILAPASEPEWAGVNVEVAPQDTPEGQGLLLTAGTILVNDDLVREVDAPVSGEMHNIVHLGSSDPLRRIAPRLMNARSDPGQHYRAVVASSKVEALSETSRHYPLTFHQVWDTGLPRHDFVVRELESLPGDIAQECAWVKEQVSGRRLVLMVSNPGGAEESLTDSARESLTKWLRENECVLGLRLAGSGASHPLVSMLGGDQVLDLSATRVAHVEAALRQASILVAEPTGAFVAYLHTGRPVVGFVSDAVMSVLDEYTRDEVEGIFPGAIARGVADLPQALEDGLALPQGAAYEFTRRLFHEHFDGRSADRVSERLRDLTEVYGVGKKFGERMS